MNQEIFKAMEAELEKNRINEEMDEVFFGMVESFLEGGEPEEDRVYSERVGKVTIQMSGKVVAGEGDEEDCVYVKWVKIEDKVFEIEDYFA